MIDISVFFPWFWTKASPLVFFNFLLMSCHKIRKKGGNTEHIPMERSTNESRIVVHTQTLFDIVNDGYRWRKYGQKSVKGSPYPR